jgi:hypothetical protein
VLIDVVLMGMMQMTAVQVVDMVAVANGYMSAAGAVHVGMVFMGVT